MCGNIVLFWIMDMTVYILAQLVSQSRQNIFIGQEIMTIHLTQAISYWYYFSAVVVLCIYFRTEFTSP